MTTARKVAAKETVTWGDVTGSYVRWDASDLTITFEPQTTPRVGGSSTSGLDRATQQGQQKVWFGEYTGGLSRYVGIGSQQNDLNKYIGNQGLVSRLAELGLYPPYNPAMQSSITNEIDLSAIGTKRLHAMVSAKGSTYERFLMGVGNIILAATDDSDPTLVVAKTLTNNVSAVCGDLVFNGTHYAVYATDGTTDDVRGITDVDSGLTVTEVITNASGDALRAMQKMSSLRANLYVGKHGGGTEGVWWSDHAATIPITVLQPAVYKDTKDIPGNAATATTGAALPVDAWQEVPDGNNTNNYDWGWGGLTNLMALDAVYATFANTNSPGYSYPLRMDYGGQFASIPLNAVITGIQVAVTGNEDNANRDIIYRSLQITINNQRVGADRANPNSFELNAVTDTTTTFGTTTDPWGLALTGADLATIGIRLVFNATSTNHAGTASIDTAKMTITYRVPGTQATVGVSTGFKPCEMPNFPNRLVYINQPYGDSPVTLPAELMYIDAEYDTNGNRPVVSFTWPNTGGLRYVWHASSLAGGIAVGGATTISNGAPLFDTTILVKDDGTPLDLQLPHIKLNASGSFKTWYGNALTTVGTYLAAQMVEYDGTTVTDMQWWFWDSARQNPGWYTDTVIGSLLTPAIDKLPVPYAEFAINTESSYAYTLWDGASHHIYTRNEYIPSDLNADPRVSRLHGLYDGPLSLIGREMYVSYPEAGDTIVSLAYEDETISVVSPNTTGQVTADIETGGDAAFGSPAISHKFTAAFESYSTLTPAKTIIPRFTLDAGTTFGRGPVGPKVLMTTVPDWNLLRRFTFDVSGWPAKTIMAKLDEIEVLQATGQNVQLMTVGDKTYNASFDPASSLATGMPPRGAPASDDKVQKASFVFRQVPS